jgi:hypothetical protein
LVRVARPPRAYGLCSAGREVPDPFLSCPLKAVIRYELAKQGHTLSVHGGATNVAQDLLESWEAVVPGTHFLTAEEVAA